MDQEKFEFSVFFSQYNLPLTVKACWGEEKEREKALAEVSEILRLLENELKEKRFFGGQTLGMVDIVANFIGLWLGAFEEASGVQLMTREKLPKLCDWIDEFVSSSITKESLPPRDKLIVYLRNRFGGANVSK
ncbi:Glutathione S-transferase U8 [Morella rubra]|uniref:Glutathione S-transferase U8 n=1 Tax=Morella rubra TaxID=262757 RepID=A0A6A1USB7_9ROSI|nr:Glutathione S-transferase U8 [Morella rubra]